jgi:hypothetical protein
MDSANNGESADHVDIMNDNLFENNFHEIRKKVFVKERVTVKPKKVFKNNKLTSQQDSLNG